MIGNTSCQSVQPGSGKFLFIPDVTASAHGGVLILLIVLYIGSQLVSSLMTTATVDRNQRLIALGLPFVFTIFILSFPAGLILYWITTNLWTVGQQYIVRRYFPPPNLAGAGADAGKLSLRDLFSPAGGGKKPDAASAKGAPTRRPKGEAAPRGAAKGKAGSDGKAAATTAPTATKKQPAGKATAAAGARAGARRKGVGANGSASGGAGTTKAGANKEGAAKEGAAKEGAAKGGAAKDGPSKASAKDGAAKSPSAPRPRGSAPPPPPRKKKKRSGRRR
jgi:hypothetical protein